MGSNESRCAGQQGYMLPAAAAHDRFIAQTPTLNRVLVRTVYPILK